MSENEVVKIKAGKFFRPGYQRHFIGSNRNHIKFIHSRLLNDAVNSDIIVNRDFISARHDENCNEFERDWVPAEKSDEFQ